MHHVVKRLQKLAKLNIQTKVEFFLSRGRMRSTILGVNMNVVIIWWQRTNTTLHVPDFTQSLMIEGS